MDHKIKVLFQSRLDLFKYTGGDTNQILETKRELEKLGVEVDIDNSLNPDLAKYDLIHIFNLDWVCEPYLQIKNAKKQGKPAVLSPIHHSLKEFRRYEQEYRFGLAKIGNFLLPYQPLRDVARNVTKGIFYLPKLKPALIQLFMGIRKQQKYVIEMADHIIVQTNREAKDLKEAYNTKKFDWTKVVNGVNLEKFNNKNIKVASNFIGNKKFIYCVGRIEPRKNQLKLIEVFLELKGSHEKFKDFSLVFSGAFNHHHPTYIRKFKKITNEYEFIIHTGFLEQQVLAGLYFKSTIFASPSWFETTGLVYLEAIVSGAKSVLASGERAREYLENNAVYCDPGDDESIKKGLIECLDITVEKKFLSKVKENYNWKNSAKQTLEVYRQIL